MPEGKKDLADLHVNPSREHKPEADLIRIHMGYSLHAGPNVRRPFKEIGSHAK